MKQRLLLGQRLPARPVDLQVLRRIIRTLVQDLLRRPVLELGIYIVGAPEITQLNETFLQHQGPTDVITFDYTEGSGGPALAGEVFICLEVAQNQARRFRVDWQTELVRYAIHGLLHLCGHDDQVPSARSRMKKQENRLLATLQGRFDLAALAWSHEPKPKLRAPKASRR